MRRASKRSAAYPDRFFYDVPEVVRRRFILTLENHDGGEIDVTEIFREAGRKIMAKHGGLYRPSYEAARTSNDPVIEHLFCCNDEEALYFIEFCCATRGFGHGEQAEQLVEEINKIFEEEGLGYELTPPRKIDTGKPGYLFGRRTPSNTFRIEPPRIIRKDERTVHEKAVQPALEVLADARFVTANSELLKAFEEVRHGDYADAITSCGSAFESVLKTICDVKGWPHEPKATCSKLVDACYKAGLFPSIYVEMLKGIGSIRNNLGDAHGKGPKPSDPATRDHAEHMIATTCSHITFLVRQAGL